MDDKIKDYVKRGKACLKKIQNYQIEIAAMAVELCEIRHGGITPKTIYTIKDYARDIGMNHKTLSNWITVYRDIICKLPKAQQENPSWKAARKAHECLRTEQTIKNKNTGMTGRISHYKRNVPASKVQSLYNQINDSDKPFVSEFFSMMQQMKNKKHLLKTRDLNIIEDENMIALMELFDECSDLINEHLTNKKKKRNYTYGKTNKGTGRIFATA